MSGTTETEMQIQIVTHGEAFCPSTMTKDTPFASRKLLLEEITNNERNEMEEAQMEENEIKEGHDDVEEEQDNKAKDTPFANRKLLEDDTTNNERNEMEEVQTEENELKEGQEKVRKAKVNKND
ncbi:uncharacterized protein LOC132752536 [Ruditapes philippinarum]|uniref:uncharacterized protein LOC132752536 n=1 Tax=Ruditapes philippinarum TaxID=129788 RepID=UPI00295B2A4B|nr:uncharacterized protein LOC132752536 [Ruditapes philippinarum]